MRTVPAICLLALLAGCGGPAAPPTAPPTSAPARRAVSIAAAGGATLAGHVYGSGRTAVVLSNMGDNDPAPWEGFAPLLAERGYTVLTYTYRYPRNSRNFTPEMANGTVDDLRAAIAYVTGAGATRLVLAGASLGGIATAKVAGGAKADAVVLMASVLDLVGYVAVTGRELATLTAPTLVVASEADATVPFARTREVYDRVPGPKRLLTFPGTEHGVHLFAGGHGDDLRRQLIDFVTSTVPA